MMCPQLWSSSLKACEAWLLDQCSKFYGVWIALKGACVCCGPDSVFIATVQNSKKKKKKHPGKSQSTSQAARSRGALVWGCVSAFWSCLCSVRSLSLLCCVLTPSCFLLQLETFSKQPLATWWWLLNCCQLTHLVQPHHLMSPVCFCLWISICSCHWSLAVKGDICTTWLVACLKLQHPKSSILSYTYYCIIKTSN